jgi:hypothetical protein
MPHNRRYRVQRRRLSLVEYLRLLRHRERLRLLRLRRLALTLTLALTCSGRQRLRRGHLALQIEDAKRHRERPRRHIVAQLPRRAAVDRDRHRLDDHLLKVQDASRHAFLLSSGPVLV